MTTMSGFVPRPRLCETVILVPSGEKEIRAPLVNVSRGGGDLVQAGSVRVDEVQIVLSVLILMGTEQDPSAIRRPIRPSAGVEPPRRQSAKVRSIQSDAEHRSPATAASVEQEVLSVGGMARVLPAQSGRARHLVPVRPVSAHHIDGHETGIVVEPGERDPLPVRRPGRIEILDAVARNADVVAQARQVRPVGPHLVEPRRLARADDASHPGEGNPSPVGRPIRLRVQDGLACDGSVP